MLLGKKMIFLVVEEVLDFKLFLKSKSSNFGVCVCVFFFPLLEE